MPLEMFTIRGRADRRSAGRNALLTASTPNRFVSYVRGALDDRLGRRLIIEHDAGVVDEDVEGLDPPGGLRGARPVGDLRPADVGLPAGPRRRTPGLRREEVTGLAHMSVEYYARLEQTRGPHPSPRILEAVTGALRLTAAERAHLFRLAGANPAPPAGPSRDVRPYVTELLRRMPEAAAVITAATYDVIA